RNGYKVPVSINEIRSLVVVRVPVKPPAVAISHIDRPHVRAGRISSIKSYEKPSARSATPVFVAKNHGVTRRYNGIVNLHPERYGKVGCAKIEFGIDGKRDMSFHRKTCDCSAFTVLYKSC